MDIGERMEMTMVIYEDLVRNDEVMINTEMIRTERQQALEHTGRVSVKNRRHRSVQVCLCLLSVLLFTAVIVICVYFNNERNQLLTHNCNLTKKREELLTHNCNLTEKREELLTHNCNLTKKREELLTHNYNLIKEREELLTHNYNLTKEREELITHNFNLLKEREKLLTHNYNLTKVREELLTKCSKLLNQDKILTEEEDQFKKKSDNINNALAGKKNTMEVNGTHTLVTNISQNNFLCVHQNKDIYTDLHFSNFTWIYYRFSFYYVSSGHKNWRDSRRDCEEKRADLLIINNQEEELFLRMHAGLGSWIGLTNEQGVWKWVDGTTLTSGYWLDGYPRNSGCALMTESGWADHMCSVKYKWICERRIV